ncbi:MAG: glycosyltransferase [Candidatus Omnitrophica bacterium]|nr:glycosyltransferase [Candidatus Omnitrophota bacterium]
MQPPFVSVIIPVFNDAKRLKLCLDALLRQTYPKNRYEVIVVDNGSTDNIREVISNFPSVIFTSEKYPTSYAARNKGISIAKGEILAFTDSDCIPYSNWIENGVKALFSVPNCGLAGGRIRLFPKNFNKITAIEFFEMTNILNQKNFIRVKFAATANVFIFKHIIDTIGNFDISFKSGGDVDLGRRIFKAGYNQIYADGAIVLHPTRGSLKRLLLMQQRIAGGLYNLQFKYDKIDLKKFICEQWPKKTKFIYLWKSTKNKNLFFRLKVIFTLILVQIIRISEFIRLCLGGKPRR